MLYLTCTTITSIDLAHYGVSRAQDWVSVKCGIISYGDLVTMIIDDDNTFYNWPENISFAIPHWLQVIDKILCLSCQKVAVKCPSFSVIYPNVFVVIRQHTAQYNF